MGSATPLEVAGSHNLLKSSFPPQFSIFTLHTFFCMDYETLIAWTLLDDVLYSYAPRSIPNDDLAELDRAYSRSPEADTSGLWRIRVMSTQVCITISRCSIRVLLQCVSIGLWTSRDIFSPNSNTTIMPLWNLLDSNHRSRSLA